MEVFAALYDIEAEFEKIVTMVIRTVESGGTLLTAGNGGSASDAQHFAGELVGRYTSNRRPIPCVCLSSDASVVTCISNDFGYDTVFTRQVEAFAGPNNLLFLLSTSGKSENLIQAAINAKKCGMKTVALLGKDGGDLVELVDEAIVVSSNSTARIQECHIFLIHSICDAIEDFLNE